jgi:hypothetical protein
MYVHPQVSLRSRKAVVALALAVACVLFGWTGAWILLTPLTIVFGALALRDVRKGRAVNGRRMAWCAIAMSILAPVVWILLYLVVLAGGGAYFG